MIFNFTYLTSSLSGRIRSKSNLQWEMCEPDWYIMLACSHAYHLVTWTSGQERELITTGLPTQWRWSVGLLVSPRVVLMNHLVTWISGQERGLITSARRNAGKAKPRTRCVLDYFDSLCCAMFTNLLHQDVKMHIKAKVLRESTSSVAQLWRVQPSSPMSLDFSPGSWGRKVLVRI